MLDRTVKPHTPGRFDRDRFHHFGVVVRLLAALDAVALPALGGYWVSTWPAKTGGLGFFAGAVMALWGAKRLSQAVFGFPDYRWFSRHLVKAGAATLIVWAAVRVFG
ncbi:MAG: hypothetical protein JF606_25265 [Burkholderiales bacterium]|nr:hypothetical protein [Burkholderiales bacterium]